MDAYSMGYNAYNDSESLDANPFEDGCEDFSEWRLGWLDAQESDSSDPEPFGIDDDQGYDPYSGSINYWDV